MAAHMHRTRRTPVPTIKTLAEITGYSIATISKALRDSPVVAPVTRDLIFKAAREVGYQANARGMALRTGKSFQAAVLMPVTAARDYEWDGVEYTQILSGVSQALDGTDYRMSVHVIRDAADGAETARRIVDQGLADGLIFSGILADDPRIDLLVDHHFPFVSMGVAARIWITPMSISTTSGQPTLPPPACLPAAIAASRSSTRSVGSPMRWTGWTGLPAPSAKPALPPLPISLLKAIFRPILAGRA